MSSVLGNKVKLSVFGESHGRAIGCVIDGLPAGIQLDFDKINREMARRAPGKDKTATRYTAYSKRAAGWDYNRRTACHGN